VKGSCSLEIREDIGDGRGVVGERCLEGMRKVVE